MMRPTVAAKLLLILINCCFVVRNPVEAHKSHIRHSPKASPLSHDFYHNSCPNLASIVEDLVIKAVNKEKRMAASLLRLHFHDCFVNGCDASILLDDTDSAKGEKTSPPNNNSVRGYDVIDDIKAAVESACPATVSCADIVALAANVSVARVGGPSWKVLLGRRDSLTASYDAPSQFLPGFNENLTAIIAKFATVGLSAKDTVVLSGAHSIGEASCKTVSYRLYNYNGTGKPDPALDAGYLAYLQKRCPQNQNSTTMNALDVTTPETFDNKFYTNLLSGEGYLESDQELYSTAGAAYSARLVRSYGSSQSAFFAAFAESMIKMGNISPLTGAEGQIRLNCRKAN